MNSLELNTLLGVFELVSDQNASSLSVHDRFRDEGGGGGRGIASCVGLLAIGEYEDNVKGGGGDTVLGRLPWISFQNLFATLDPPGVLMFVYKYVA